MINSELSINWKIPEKKTQHSLYKNIVFNIDNNKKKNYAPNQHIYLWRITWH